ncbi:MAG TPA: LPS assembly lipoprotein LptE [Burkholderiales bacterium]|nr:LPS assembly lipoprotein LptE [Burkholderiales bacterium]
MRAALASVLALLLAACGFQLRGTADLPFQTIYVPGATGGIALEVKREIEAGSHTRVVDDPKQAQAQLQITQETQGSQILALDVNGRVRELRLLYTVSFRVVDPKGGDFVPPTTVQLGRDVTYNDADILAKQAEQTLLYRDMQTDMVQQIMRRLAASKAPKA